MYGPPLSRPTHSTYTQSFVATMASMFSSLMWVWDRCAVAHLPLHNTDLTLTLSVAHDPTRLQMMELLQCNCEQDWNMPR